MSRRPVVLVVDDEPKNVRLLNAILGREDVDIINAGTGKECLERVAGQSVDLILLDVTMPEIDGFEVLRLLRSDPRHRLLPVVLVTALDATEDRIRGIDAGCDDFISKPFDQNELLARVRTLLKLGYYRRQLDEKEKLEATIAAARDGIVVCSPDWGTLRFNPTAGRYFALKNSDNLLDCIRRQYRCTVPLEQLAEIERAPLEFELIREETEHFGRLHLRVSATVIRDPSGQASSVVVCFHDVTDLLRDQRLKADFVSLISHKLRTPLTPIMLHLSLLKDELSGQMHHQESVDQVSLHFKRLHVLIERLIEFAIAAENSRELPRTPVAVRDQLQAIVEAYDRDDPPGRVVLEAGAENPLIEIDPSLFDLVVTNLVDNGLKFNDNVAPKVVISIRATANNALVCVTDNGRGIPPEEHERVFDDFTQSEKYFTGSIPGLGLGLAMVRRISSAYGGRVEVASEMGKGSSLTVVFPTGNARSASIATQSDSATFDSSHR